MIPAAWTNGSTSGTYSATDLATAEDAAHEQLVSSPQTYTIPASNSAASCQLVFKVLQSINYVNPTNGALQDPIRLVTLTQLSAPPGTQLDSNLATGGVGNSAPDVKTIGPSVTVVVDANAYHGDVVSFWNSAVVTPPACTIPSVTISNTSWNKFSIPNGKSPVVWVHAHIGKPAGVPTNSISSVLFTGGSLSLDGTSYSLPDGLLTFDPSAPTNPSTSFNSGANRWETIVNPTQLSDEIFFTGAAIPVTPDVADGAKATWSFSVQSGVPNLSFSWQWSGAVYTYWPSNWNDALIQPYHSNNHAGTPLNVTVQKSLIQGPRGGGGSNFTGSWSATGTGSCPQ
ncbi:MAG: hypothetical protein ACREPM_18380 [Gemmatimonadaceae bacterium]